MAAQLTPVEMLVKEIEHMEGRKSSLQAAVKALEAKTKDIRSQLDLAEVAGREERRQQELLVARERATLAESVAPLQAKVAALTNEAAAIVKRTTDLRQQHEVFLQTKQAEVVRLTAAVAEKETRLAAVLAEITIVKAKVLGL